jgi:class 3 adenylate cyclase/predicted ATPase
MDFYTILDHVIALLQQRGRVSYRALKVQFKLDDEALEALKDELIAVHQLARDQDGRMLVWTGEASTSPEPPIVQSAHQAVRREDRRTPVEAPRAEPRSPEAERRQLTVMFCDLVDSTKLSSQLDPEEYRDVVRAYQGVCSEVITRFDGHIAQLLGDGLLVYFGYPLAHEDDAQRAVRAGLGMLAAMGDLNSRLQQQAQGIQLAIRVGIHTGLVVVGDMGGQGRQEQLALGEVPNIASRIEGLAVPNTVAISDATYRLVQGYFACQDLGAQALRGVTESMRLYQVLRESGATSRLDVAQPRGLTPLVGRESEVTLLRERWEQAKDRHGQVVLLTGDAGIGKSRLVQTLKDHVANEPHTRWECRSAEYSQNTALFPVTDLFHRLLQFQAEDTPDEKLRKLEQALSQYRLPLEESVSLFAPLLSLSLPESRYAPLNVSPQRQRQKTLESLVAILLELAEQQPGLFILEDLHWTDPTTLEWLNLLIDQTPTASMLVLLTCRPHFQPAWHHRSYLTEITVNRLSPTQVEQIVAGMTDGKTFPAGVLQQIITKTDGVPLFVEEVTKAILESGHLNEVDGHYELVGSLSTLTIPATLQDSLMARLDRLVTAKGIAQLAAVIGRQFAYPLLQAVSQVDEATLQRELRRLVEAELVYQRGVPPQATYVFKHALILDAAYESLLKSTRQHYHQRIAQVLETQFPETTEGQPELLAHHCTEAGLIEQAVGYWQKAGQSAVQRSAHVEAIGHLTRGLALLKTQPETQARVQYELHLLMLLGPVYMATTGYGAAEVLHTYGHARELCQQLGHTPQTLPALLALARLTMIRAQHHDALALGQQCLALAHQHDDPALLAAAHEAIGKPCALRGDGGVARTHLEQALRLYQAQPRPVRSAVQAPQITCLFALTWALLPLGYPQQALTCVHQARALAHALAHPFSLAFATNATGIVHQLRREPQAAYAQVEASMQVNEAQGFPMLVGFNQVLWGWTLAMQGQTEDGLTQIQQGLANNRSTGHAVFYPWGLTCLAEAYGQAGQPEAALTVVAEALTVIDTTEERLWEAELYRLKGTLLLQQSADNAPEAAACFARAMAIAHKQSAKSWELRAATSVARLWQQQGKRQEAHDLLAPVYGWFTEGFDTADLKDAKMLLDELA